MQTAKTKLHVPLGPLSTHNQTFGPRQQGIDRCGVLDDNKSMERLDSPNPLVRTIERWKRGLGAAFIIAMLALASGLVASLVALAAELLGLDAMIVGTVTLLIVAPWIAGDRRALKAIGSLSTISDD